MRSPMLSLVLTIMVVLQSEIQHALADKSEDSCSLYLAHSNVFGRLGVFTSRKLNIGTTLSMEDIVIPLIEDENPLFLDQNWSRLLGYVEWEGRTVRALLSGTGGAVNLHSKLSNIEPKLNADHGDASDLHRAKDAEAGAFSYQAMQYTVTQNIPAGGQILLYNIVSTHGLIDTVSLDGAVGGLEEMFSTLSKTEQDDFTEDFLGLIQSGLPASLTDTFPSTTQQYERAKTEGVSNAWKEEDTQVELAWLSRNGVCVDNVIHSKSTIEKAGRGAFATRTMQPGTAVVPTPVLPISRFALEKFDDDEHQLLRNYCFGHAYSTLLLCPYGSSAPYVNHANDERQNVKLTWSTKLDSMHEIMAKKSVSEILEYPELGLVFDLVATRTIEEGEELFLDYGEHWIEEWREHVSDWEVGEDSHLYQSAAQLNRENKKTNIKTNEEQNKQPYPGNVFVSVQYHIDRSAEPTTIEKLEGSVLRKIYSWTPQSHASGLTRPIHVLQRKNALFASETYTIELLNHPLHKEWDPEFIQPLEQIVITEVPRSAIHFVDVPYTSDHHLEYAFRCEIQIPDEIFPEAWIDRRDLTEEEENYFSEFPEHFFDSEDEYYEYLDEAHAEFDEEEEEL